VSQFEGFQADYAPRMTAEKTCKGDVHAHTVSSAGRQRGAVMLEGAGIGRERMWGDSDGCYTLKILGQIVSSHSLGGKNSPGVVDNVTKLQNCGKKRSR